MLKRSKRCRFFKCCSCWIHPMQYDPKAPVQVMAALGHYRDKQSVAVGASYYFNDRFMMSTGIALSGEKRTKNYG